jgi:hypothetical protein
MRAPAILPTVAASAKRENAGESELLTFVRRLRPCLGRHGP